MQAIRIIIKILIVIIKVIVILISNSRKIYFLSKKAISKQYSFKEFNKIKAIVIKTNNSSNKNKKIWNLKFLRKKWSILT